MVRIFCHFLSNQTHSFRTLFHHNISFVFLFQLRKLLTLEIWRDAAVQVFFSLGIGFGSLTVYASYNKTGFNTRSAALYYGIIDTTVGICSCIIVFSFHGFQAHTEEKKCEEQLLQSNISLSVTNSTCQSYLTKQVNN